jgi:septum site-determining protein MinC
MRRESIVGQSVEIKGIRDGLLIRVDDHPEFAIVELLADELAAKQEFLRGSRIAVEVGQRELSYEQLVELQRLFEGHDLTLWALLTQDAATRDSARRVGLATRLSGSATDLEGNALPVEPADSATPAARPPPGPNALLLRETVRSGRSVWHEGHVIILGDVNPGAEVIATGNVIVWGRLRGLVHAGALGDAGAVICALDLSPTQLRIADQIAVAPPDSRHAPIPEQAAIRDGQIVAESWSMRH